jgi:hypothetical protein
VRETEYKGNVLGQTRTIRNQNADRKQEACTAILAAGAANKRQEQRR